MTKPSILAYGYIFGCIFFTVYGQLILKWRMTMKGDLPPGSMSKIHFLLGSIFLDPFVLSGFVAAFMASLFWLAAMTKFEVSFAYPFMSLAFVFVSIFGIFFLGEAWTIGKLLGLALITAGLIAMVKF